MPIKIDLKKKTVALGVGDLLWNRTELALQAKKDAQAVVHVGHDGGRDFTPFVEQPTFGDGPNRLAQRSAVVLKAALAGRQGDVEWNLAEGRGQRNDNNQTGWSAIERINRDDQYRTAARLFMATRGIEVCEPDLTATKSCHYSPSPKVDSKPTNSF
jgi:hypothetical protein